MKEYIRIIPPSGPIKATIRLPSSKSISNRVLIMAALGGFRHVIQDLSDAEDTQRLDHLVNERPQVLDCGAGGTTLRFAMAWAAIQEGEERLITGIRRLLERPHEPLVQALIALGASIERVPEGYKVTGRRLRGGTVELDAPLSSQYISALLLIAPYMENGLEIYWRGERVSEPYVRMTIKLMAHFGVKVKVTDEALDVRPGTYVSEIFSVPPDWSAASFWYEITALARDAQVQLIGLFDDGIQGDAIAAAHWKRWVITEVGKEGSILRHRTPTEAEKEFNFDLKDSPDLFQPLAFTCAATGASANFTGLGTLPLKEADRLEATRSILVSLGANAEPAGQDLHIPAWQLIPSSAIDVPIIDPQGDHRMAMATAPLAVFIEGIRIADPDVVKKSYPLFWDHLQIAGFQLERVTVEGSSPA